MIIRQALPEDIDLVVPLFDAYRQFYEQLSNPEAGRRFLEERLKNKESVIFLAMEENKAVGFTQLYPIFSSVSLKKAWLLNDLYVEESARKKGAATKLLKAAEEHGRRNGASWLLLETAHDNYTAQMLYEKAGWERESAYYYRLIL